MDWKTLAHELPLGQKTRHSCECGDGNTLVINHNTKHYSCYCFRCDFSGVEWKGKQTLEELAKIRKLNAEANQHIQAGVKLPDDYTEDIPLRGRLWLYSAGITESIWKHYRIGYSEKLQRVVLPVWSTNGDLIWFQCRALLEGQRPKYLQPSRGRDRILFRSSRHPTTDGSVTVVEDILSAIKVGEATEAVSILGTKITTNQANDLAEYAMVNVWLDPDTAGRRGARSISKTLGLVTETRIITSEVDPKLLSVEEIKDKLCQ